MGTARQPSPRSSGGVVAGVGGGRAGAHLELLCGVEPARFYAVRHRSAGQQAAPGGGFAVFALVECSGGGNTAGGGGGFAVGLFGVDQRGNKKG